MSLIHEALEKLDQEKKKNVSFNFKPAPPPLPTAPELKLKKEEPRQENQQLIYGIVGVLFLLFIFGLIYFLSGSGSSRETAVPSGKESSFVPDESYEQPVLIPPLTLTGITRLGEGWTAIINNQLVRTGDEVSGAKVMAIQQENVVLDVKGRAVTLNLHEGKI